MRSAAMVAWARPRMTSEASITFWRGRRSAQTPPIGKAMTRATVAVPRTSPRAVAERAMERVAKARATGTRASPKAETPWPIHRRRKLGWVRGERAAGSGIRRLCWKGEDDGEGPAGVAPGGTFE